MDTEIKFKIWNIRTGKYEKYDLQKTLITEHENAIIYRFGSPQEIILRHKDLQFFQYTGVNDVEGNEICLGDVLEDKDVETGMVVIERLVDIGNIDSRKHRIIGNVIDNPPQIEK